MRLRDSARLDARAGLDAVSPRVGGYFTFLGNILPAGLSPESSETERDDGLSRARAVFALAASAAETAARKPPRSVVEAAAAAAADEAAGACDSTALAKLFSHAAEEGLAVQIRKAFCGQGGLTLLAAERGAAAEAASWMLLARMCPQIELRAAQLQAASSPARPSPPRSERHLMLRKAKPLPP